MVSPWYVTVSVRLVMVYGIMCCGARVISYVLFKVQLANAEASFEDKPHATFDTAKCILLDFKLNHIKGFGAFVHTSTLVLLYEPC